LLPALPTEWREGTVKGLRARGGVEVDVAWKDGWLTSATLRSDFSGPCRVSCQGKSVELKLKKGSSLSLNSELK